MTTIKDCNFTVESEPWENVVARTEAVIKLAEAIKAAAEALRTTPQLHAPIINIE